MRPAPNQLLASPSALSLLRNRLLSNQPFPYELACRDGGGCRWSTTVARAAKEEHESNTPRPSGKSEPFTMPKGEKRPALTKLFSFRNADSEYEQTGQQRHVPILTQANTGTTPARRDLLGVPKQEQEATNWFKVLEIVRDRRRHSGISGAQMVYSQFIKIGLDMPIEGEVAVELWDHFIQIGYKDLKFLRIIAKYAVELRRRTGRARHDFYVKLVGNQLQCSPSLALPLHQSLKTDFPPKPNDYAKLLHLSLKMGQESFAAFGKIYKDFPAPEMYPIIVPELCRRGMRAEATKWHYLLLNKGDLPKSFHDCKPLLDHYAHVKKAKEVENLVKSLARVQVWFERDMDRFVRNDKFISREILNRALGEAHGIAPKMLSDGFCARLFATTFFSVDLVINGLQAMGVDSLGSSSMRELVVRDNYRSENVAYHLDRLREVGISLQASSYNLMIRKAAVGGQSKLLKSIVDTDLHPDTFEDMNLQERLLAKYCREGDQAQMDRTFAIIESAIPERSLKMQRANLLLRCHISLRNRTKVISILESMQRDRLPLTPRSSRHLRVSFMSQRRKGVRPSEARPEVENLTLIINVTKMTLESGASIPLESWIEILRRLGMMGYLNRYQNLALWLVDWYSRLPGSEPILPPQPPETQAIGSLPSTRQLFPQPFHAEDGIDHGSPLAFLSNALIPNHDLLVLFGKQAQQGIIAWGFQAEVKRRPRLPQPRNIRLPNPRTHWQWGLRLLKELQARGVPIQKIAVARACKLRLAQLFNHKVVSSKIANRRAQDLNNVRSTLMAKYRYSAYVREMEEIWGQDLFDLGPNRPENHSAIGEVSFHAPIGRKWKIIPHHKHLGLEKDFHSEEKEEMQ